MKMRKCISVLLAVMMLISCLTVTAFADTDQETKVPDVPDAVALVTVDNVNCKVINDIKDLSVVIKFKDDGRVIANIPVVKVENAADDTVALWLGYEPTEAILDEIKDEMSEIQKDFHFPSWNELMDLIMNSTEKELEAYMENLENVLGKILGSYTVELTGLPEAADHEYKYEADVMILNSKLVNEMLTFCKELIGQMFEMTDAEIAEITTFSGWVDALEKEMVEQGVLEPGEDFLDMLEDSGAVEFTAEERAEVEAAIAEIDNILAYMKSEAYKGTVIAGVSVTCGCPHLVTYEVIHQYFKVTNGKAKLVGTVYEGDKKDSFGDKYYEGWEGTTVKASDYINCDYKGNTYEYVGSYDSINVFYESWAQDFYDERDYYDRYEVVDEYTLAYNDVYAPEGILLCYEIVDNTETSPSTGDDSNMGIYVGIMALAVAAMAAAVLVRRRKN